MLKNIVSYLKTKEEIFQSISKNQTIRKLIKVFDISEEEALKAYYEWKKEYLKSTNCKPIIRNNSKKEKVSNKIEFIVKNWGVMNSFDLADKLNISYAELRDKAKELELAPIGVKSYYQYSKEEDEKILELKNNLYTNREIGKELGRSEAGIYRRIHMLKRLKNIS